MAEGNGTKVIIGCCSAVAVAGVAVVLGLFVLTNKGCEMLQGALKKNEQNVAAVESWKNSLEVAGGDPIKASPEEFGGFERQQQSSDVNPPGFDLGKTGQLDEYLYGSSKLSVWIAPATSLEQEAVVERLKQQLDSRFSSKSHASFSSSGTGYLRYTGSSPTESGFLAYAQGWLLLLQTDDESLDLQDYLTRYARAAKKQTAAGAPAGEAEDASSPDPKPEVEAINPPQ